MKREVVIIHYNTPELTAAAILSLRKHGGENYHVTVLDNSDKRPFLTSMQNCKREMTSLIAEAMHGAWPGGLDVIDNTHGQLIDFDEELKKYPDRDAEYGCAKGCVFGSDKHMMSVQKMWDVIDAPFLLMDSDILVQDSVDFMFQDEQCAVGHISMGSGLIPRERLLPYLLFINVPLCKERGACFFDPKRAWALHKGSDSRNFWDTGAALLNDIRSHKNGLCGVSIDIRPLMVHLGSGSWEKNEEEKHERWLRQYRHLWHIPDSANANKSSLEKTNAKYTVLTYIFGDYDLVQEVVEKDPDAEYLLITDNENIRSRTWTVVHDRTMDGWSVMDKCYYVRFHPFKFAHTDIVVRIDGSIELRKPLTELVQAFEDGGYDRCMMIHPTRSTFDEELECWVKTRNYSKTVAERCLKMMRGFGYDIKKKGLFQGCFEIVRNTDVNNDINRLTYHLMKYTGGEEIDRLDQHITTFVINTQFNHLKILAVGEDLITDGQLMQWMMHKSKMPIPVKESTKAYMFGKPCRIWKPGMNPVASAGSKPEARKRRMRKGNSLENADS